MCNLYSITTNQAAIAALFRVINRYVGWPVRPVTGLAGGPMSPLAPKPCEKRPKRLAGGRRFGYPKDTPAPDS